ncbi:MAG: hypothetical protein OHK0015_41390 [Chloroflexi bacterium OHK40]
MATRRLTQRLIPTKLVAPASRPGWIARARLLDELAAPPPPRLTLVVAPAGFGKSTLVAQWLATTSRPVAWLSLDEFDQDSVRLLAYLAGAIAHAGCALPRMSVLLAERWSNEEIATRLVVTVNTVRKHTSAIYDKLGVASRREAVAIARTIGLLPAG